MRKQFDLIKLKFTSPLHLGRGQTDFYDKSETVLHSDTLKSALFSCAIRQDKSLGIEFLDSFKISSAFPFSGDTYFLPKPIGLKNLSFKDCASGPKMHKTLKKIQYLDIKLFEKLINGTSIASFASHLSKNKKFLYSEKQSDSGNNWIFKSEDQQRLVMPDHNSSETDPTPYIVERLYFNDDAGMYFLLECDKNPIKEKVISALKILQDQGIGTDRNVGNGQFQYEITSNFSLEVHENSGFYYNTSLYLPEKQEFSQIALDKSRYSVIKRGGYISSPENDNFLTYRKKWIYMFEEGSIFNSGVSLEGKIIDLKPKTESELHPIYRDGRSIMIPVTTP